MKRKSAHEYLLMSRLCEDTQTAKQLGTSCRGVALLVKGPLAAFPIIDNF